MSDPGNLFTFMGDMENLEGIAKKLNRLIVVDFFATWCGPCKRFGEILPNICREFPKVCFLKADVDAATEVAQRYGVQSVPTIKFFKWTDDHLQELATVQGGDVAAVKANIQKLM